MTDNETATLPDVPTTGFGAFFEETREPLADGWYQGTIESQYTMEKEDGSTVVYETQDSPSNDGSSRNIALRVKVTPKSTNRPWNTRTQINYRPLDLTGPRKESVLKARESGDKANKDITRSSIALGQLARLEKIAGGSLIQNGNGGFDLSGLVGKTVYVRRGDETDNRTTPPKVFKAIVEFSHTAPKKAAVL